MVIGATLCQTVCLSTRRHRSSLVASFTQIYLAPIDRPILGAYTIVILTSQNAWSLKMARYSLSLNTRNNATADVEILGSQLEIAYSTSKHDEIDPLHVEGEYSTYNLCTRRIRHAFTPQYAMRLHGNR